MDNSSESGVTGCRISDATRRRENVGNAGSEREKKKREKETNKREREVLKKSGGRELRE